MRSSGIRGDVVWSLAVPGMGTVGGAWSGSSSPMAVKTAGSATAGAGAGAGCAPSTRSPRKAWSDGAEPARGAAGAARGAAGAARGAAEAARGARCRPATRSPVKVRSLGVGKVSTADAAGFEPWLPPVKAALPKEAWYAGCAPSTRSPCGAWSSETGTAGVVDQATGCATEVAGWGAPLWRAPTRVATSGLSSAPSEG
jgi:hypothetical protein